MDRRSRLLIAAVAVVLLAGLSWLGLRWSEGRARDAADRTGVQTVRGHEALLTSELQKFRLLPLVLVEYPDVESALRGDVAGRDKLNRTLELLAARTDAADIYLIAPSGRTVAASNWRRPTSFVGQNYGFRPYFRDAMRQGAAELFALGTVSRRPGLYLARRVVRAGRAIGVVVVKVEFDSIEAAWARAPGASFVTDANGIILVTSRPAWRFRSVGRLNPAVAATARRTLQFGAAPPRPAPLTLTGATATVEGSAARLRLSTVPVPLASGRLFHLTPLEPALASARLQALLIGLGLLFGAATVAALAMRAAETRRLQQRARQALEAEVARRTAELRDANAQLTVESHERHEADRRYRAAREELAQVSRLGTLGQITAGVAHEINQPVAAIRTFAESAGTLIGRGEGATAAANIGHIVALTERIGTITAELRGFARRRTPASGTVPLQSVLDGLMILIGERARGVVSVQLEAGLADVPLRGDRVRLEQIMVNLLQNALDAVEGQAGGAVQIIGRPGLGTVEIVVADNGRGVDPMILDTLFTPFTTAKPGGLGLGLAIARDIAREFGGDLRYEDGSDGARFMLTLVVA